jgi:hypothetical protein
MPKRVTPLNAKQLANWKPTKASDALFDGAVPGLRVQSTAKGLSWSLDVYINGTRHRVALGYGLGLSEVRQRARKYRVQVWEAETETREHRAQERAKARAEAKIEQARLFAERVKAAQERKAHELAEAQKQEAKRKARGIIFLSAEDAERAKRGELFPPRPHHLYRYFDETGKLLYVGMSLSAFRRAAQHRLGSDWFKTAKNDP